MPRQKLFWGTAVCHLPDTLPNGSCLSCGLFHGSCKSWSHQDCLQVEAEFCFSWGCTGQIFLMPASIAVLLPYVLGSARLCILQLGAGWGPEHPAVSLPSSTSESCSAGDSEQRAPLSPPPASTTPSRASPSLAAVPDSWQGARRALCLQQPARYFQNRAALCSPRTRRQPEQHGAGGPGSTAVSGRCGSEERSPRTASGRRRRQGKGRAGPRIPQSGGCRRAPQPPASCSRPGPPSRPRRLPHRAVLPSPCPPQAPGNPLGPRSAAGPWCGEAGGRREAGRAPVARGC